MKTVNPLNPRSSDPFMYTKSRREMMRKNRKPDAVREFEQALTAYTEAARRAFRLGVTCASHVRLQVMNYRDDERRSRSQERIERLASAGAVVLKGKRTSKRAA